MEDNIGRPDNPQNRWSIAELRKAGDDATTPVPEGFHKELSEMIDSMDAAEKIVSSGRSGAKRIATWTMSAAAGLVLMAGAALALYDTYRSPKDTFSDPALAYAQAEKALADISARMSSCAEKTRTAEASIGKQIELIRDVYAGGNDNSKFNK